ncbi:AEC family transporter [Alkalicoccus urumqiensis]|uniref:Permease n=1 Tax=Alkalicoccus urumqiensis TaxID=1548213 RepID=A0A2P6MII9_ALKUR|nr:AEC family transporter [Alkalicoccus urumqiensis]PRO66081.1 permease [Alkalicoccus urumqiensis]
MNALGLILLDILLPVFVIMLLGYVMQLKFKMDLQTLAKLNIYFVVPAFIFVELYDNDIALGLFGLVLVFFIVYTVLLFLAGQGLSRMAGLTQSRRITFTNSLMFYNSGNYGVPVNDLVFRGDPLAMGVQVIMMTLQNVFLFSYGVFSLQAASIGKLRALLGYLKMPVMYAMVLGVLLGWLEVPLPAFVWTPAEYVADAMIAIALFTLGAQVASFEFLPVRLSVYASAAVRLIAGPAIALVILLVLPVQGMLAQALFIASAMPTSVNSAIIAQEYRMHPKYAAQIVLFSTIFSAATVTVVIYLSRVLFA